MRMMKNNRYIDSEILADEALENPSALTSKLSQLIEELADALDCIKKIAPDKYPKHYIKFSKIVNGCYFTCELYEYATSMMKNVDGTYGAKLSMDTIKEHAKKQGLVPNSIINDYDIAYIVNMYASDNWDKSLSYEENIFFSVKAAKGFLHDPDAPQHPGRALRFFTKVAMWNPTK